MLDQAADDATSDQATDSASDRQPVLCFAALTFASAIFGYINWRGALMITLRSLHCWLMIDPNFFYIQ